MEQGSALSVEARIGLQRATVAELEQSLWADGYDESGLAPYQAAFRELERLVSLGGEDRRHHFVIVIPVADSPVHLHACLASLLEPCQAFGYGGMRDERWRRVSVLLADDSGDAANIRRNREIARELDGSGLSTEYFGLPEQIALLDRLAGLDLTACVGAHAGDAFHHKGQATMRNIAWLRCAQLAAARAERPLFYTIDADQVFRVNALTPDGGREVCALNFLFYLDAIFSRTDALALTGKVVGDPPVSPAVMAGNLLEDVIGFLREMAAAEPGQPYPQPGLAPGGDAAYHDMAALFGFRQADAAYRYRCALPGQPDHAACFAEFARRLNSFFHGEHPTRVTWYEPADASASVRPARTVYTGNYVFRPEALAWLIPFAPLRLRMSGPTMGRMLKATIGPRFVSANLPMLHRRTLEVTGQAEFRPGVHDTNRSIDLCGELRAPVPRRRHAVRHGAADRPRLSRRGPARGRGGGHPGGHAGGDAGAIPRPPLGDGGKDRPAARSAGRSEPLVATHA